MANEACASQSCTDNKKNPLQFNPLYPSRNDSTGKKGDVGRFSGEKRWFEDDGLWEAVMPILFDKPRIDRAAKEVESIIALTGLQPKSRVLDLCCGIGRHSIQFAGRGFDVTGVDKTRHYIEIAQAKAKRKGLRIKFVHKDMRSYRKVGFYDLIINYFSSFGYFDSQEDDLKVVGNMFASLRGGGKLLIDLVGKETIAMHYQKKDWREEKGYILLEERTIEKDWSRINTHWIIIRGTKRIDLNFFHRLYSAAELANLLKQNGFSDVKIYGDITGKPYDADAGRLIAIATK